MTSPTAWFLESINLNHLTKFTFDEYCPSSLALGDWYIREYYVKPIREELNKPVHLFNFDV